MSIQIGTAHFFAQSTRMLMDQQARADRLNTEIATGVRVSTPSIDPIASARAAGLTRLAADDRQYLANVELAQGLLGAADSALETMEIGAQRARELALRAANETLTPEDRGAIATELRAIVDDLFATANQVDARGTPLFGGSGDGPAFTRDADGVIAYAGTGEPPELPIGAGGGIAPGDSGQRLFGGIDRTADGDPRDMFQVLSDFADAIADPTLDPAARRAAIDTGVAGVEAITDRLAGARASVGARGARLDVEAARIETLADTRTAEAKLLTGADLQKSIADLQQTLLLLQASQASFTRIASLSLFDQI